MARTAMIEKQKRKPRFKVQGYNRCQSCGRPRGFLRKFQMCRLCFRDAASHGLLPGVTKASW